MHRLCVLDKYKNLCLWGTFDFVGVRECPRCEGVPACVYTHNGTEWIFHADWRGHVLSNEHEYSPCMFESREDVRPLYTPLLQQLHDLRVRDQELGAEECRVATQRDEVGRERNRLLDLLMSIKSP